MHSNNFHISNGTQLCWCLITNALISHLYLIYKYIYVTSTDWQTASGIERIQLAQNPIKPLQTFGGRSQIMLGINNNSDFCFFTEAHFCHTRKKMITMSRENFAVIWWYWSVFFPLAWQRCPPPTTATRGHCKHSHCTLETTTSSAASPRYCSPGFWWHSNHHHDSDPPGWRAKASTALSEALVMEYCRWSRLKDHSSSSTGGGSWKFCWLVLRHDGDLSGGPAPNLLSLSLTCWQTNTHQK